MKAKSLLLLTIGAACLAARCLAQLAAVQATIRLSSGKGLQALLVFLLLGLSSSAQAQFNHTTDNGQITITGYTGPAGAVTIPSMIAGLPVIRIGEYAFYYRTGLTSVTIPSSVTSIGGDAFFGCAGLTSVTIPNSVTSIGPSAFAGCASLSAIMVDAGNSSYSSSDGVLFNKSLTTFIQYPSGKTRNYTIPISVTSIENYAFYDCAGLTSVTIPSSVTIIVFGAFAGCTGLAGVYFEGNAPDTGRSPFPENTIIYYLPGANGWTDTFSGRPTALWKPQALTDDDNFGARAGQFGFTISWASDRVIVVEASPDLANPVWTPVGTNTLTGGSSYFSDPQWTNHPARLYRLRSP